jgi:hypothetical protein
VAQSARDVAAEGGLDVGPLLRGVHLGQLQRQSRHELELDAEAHERLEVGERVDGVS